MHLEELRISDLDIALREPFGIATGAQLHAHNLLVEVHARGPAGPVVGFGEAAPFPAVNGETQEMARGGLEEARHRLLGTDLWAWRAASAVIGDLPASARCAVEMAITDVLCRAGNLPMWAFFGGYSTKVETDVTITTGTTLEAAEAAARLAADGIRILKVKVGGTDLGSDVDRLQVIVRAAPGCELLLDANGALQTPEAAARLVKAVREAGGHVVLFEQPLRDLDGLAAASRLLDCPVAADESVKSAADVVRIAERKAAAVVNLKATKSGFVAAHDMALLARGCGLRLMIGAMVESPLALTASACLAAGLGGFGFVDLDTHLWMVDPPLSGGFVQRGPVLDLAGIHAGHGVRPR